MIYKSPKCFLSSFKSVGLSVQEKKWKKDFQDGSHLGFSIGNILASFDLQVPLMLPTKFQVNCPFSSGKQVKNRFSRWPSSWISDLNNFSFFFLSTSHLDTSYQVSSQLAFQFRRRSKNRFLRWPQWRPSWISDRNIFRYFWSTSHPDASYQVSSWLAFLFRRRSEKKIFNMATMVPILDFRSGTILANFDLQVTQMLPTKFQVNWPFGSGEEAKKRFSRWLSWMPDHNSSPWVLHAQVS